MSIILIVLFEAVIFQTNDAFCSLLLLLHLLSQQEDSLTGFINFGVI